MCERMYILKVAADDVNRRSLRGSTATTVVSGGGHLIALQSHGTYHAGMKTIIDSEGRIVVPKSVRDQPHLTPGSKLERDVLADSVVIRHRDNNLQQRGFGHDKYHTSGCDSRTDQDI